MRKKRSRRAKKKAGRRKVSKKAAKKVVKKAAKATKAAIDKLMSAMSNQRLAEEEAGEAASIKLANRKALEHAFSGGHVRDRETKEAAGLMARGLAAFSNVRLQRGSPSALERKKRK
jgi:hypothetical protein